MLIQTEASGQRVGSQLITILQQNYIQLLSLTNKVEGLIVMTPNNNSWSIHKSALFISIQKPMEHVRIHIMIIGLELSLAKTVWERLQNLYRNVIKSSTSPAARPDGKISLKVLVKKSLKNVLSSLSVKRTILGRGEKVRKRRWLA